MFKRKQAIGVKIGPVEEDFWEWQDQALESRWECEWKQQKVNTNLVIKIA